ncbi:hypothetical protein OJ996_13055 [Luteolibacter sp. GHJ8]|uniref:Vitamin K epoxide reductase domain-containing protein n=1 Tax=Luteolibacter rhizosphaerae TaxID=2989719 RepID=A0ABT3G5J9_9BACT|nr:vitamin K epoxide reductase family protein [Luteolibacter rhizosphaerae]MCW1914510.1 hypothetical protein [Luteolibacter rhizosphaerae]
MILLRLLFLAGIALSAWLLTQKVTGEISYLAGCGAGSACANVLGSKWSQWFLIPVSALSLLLYAALLFFTFKPSRSALLGLGTALAAAALWFGIVQAFILRSFCPWCLSAHAIGLGCALLIFRLHRREISAGPLVAGILGTVILAAGQVLGPAPKTHQESQAIVESSGPVHSRGGGRKETFLGNKEYNVTGLPHVGNPNSRRVVVDYFDYTCDACRNLHVYLNEFMVKHPGELCVVVLPCPLERHCNPALPENVSDHPRACELARLALACWRVAPEKFSAVHQLLFERPAIDRGAIEKLVGTPLKEDAWIDEILAANVEDYRKICAANRHLEAPHVLPKLLVRGTKMMHGSTGSREQFFRALEQEFMLK